MNSLYFGVVCVAIVYVIFWSVRNDKPTLNKIDGLLAMRRQDDGVRGKQRARRIR